MCLPSSCFPRKQQSTRQKEPSSSPSYNGDDNATFKELLSQSLDFCQQLARPAQGLFNKLGESDIVINIGRRRKSKNQILLVNEIQQQLPTTRQCSQSNMKFYFHSNLLIVWVADPSTNQWLAVV